MADLVLGNSPDKLTVNLVTNDPVSFSLTLKLDGVPTPWPSAPTLEFPFVGDGTVVWTSTLTEDDSKATWSEDEAHVNAVLAASDRKARLAVGGVTWWAGAAAKRA